MSARVTILTSRYIPADDRTDTHTHVIGDVVSLTLSCGHHKLGVPHAMYTPGENTTCQVCCTPWSAAMVDDCACEADAR